MALLQRNGIWYWRKMVDGVTFNRSTKTTDRKQAEMLAKKWDHEAVQTVVYDGERPVTVHEAITAFLDERKHLPGHTSATCHMAHWKAGLPNVLMKSLQHHQVQEVVTNRAIAGVAQNTLAVFVTYWNALNNFCVRRKLSSGPKLERVHQKQTRFRIINTKEEVAMLAATCPKANYPGKCAMRDEMRQVNQDLLVCFLHLGARITEAQNLRWSDINFEENTILVRRLKRGEECLLLMTNALRAVLERRHPTRTNNFVFPSKAGHPMNTKWIHCVVKRAGINLEAGKITAHTFRHSCATRLLRAGMDIRMVQKFLGHRNITSTLVYLHATPSEVAEQAAAVFNAG